jgi:peroxiredoxin Q/BCP
VIGISTDTLAAQEMFTEKEKLTFPLYADPDKKAAREYGVLTPRGYANRSTFVIDKKGIVRKVYPMANAQTHPDEVLKYIKDNLAEKK